MDKIDDPRVDSSKVRKKVYLQDIGLDVNLYSCVVTVHGLRVKAIKRSNSGRVRPQNTQKNLTQPLLLPND